MTWAVEFYEEENGNSPVEAFLSRLPQERRAKALAIIKRLEEAGPTLPFPYSSQVRGKIRELRTQYGKDKIRILYFADKQRRFILLHAFIKRTEKLSAADIEIADRRMKHHDRKIGNPTGQKRRAMEAKSHPRGNPSHFLKDPQFEILGEKGIPKWVRIRGSYRETEFEFWHEVEERKGSRKFDLMAPKLVTIRDKFGKATFELSEAEQGVRMKGRIDCGPLEMILYPDPDDFPQPLGSTVSRFEHKCERKEDDCVKEEFLRVMGIEIPPLM